ncbi:hypothetical protein [Paenibacillus sp. H1-7]|nr:hypothetical protein [Paenibacillus sp. H1-7]
MKYEAPNGEVLIARDALQASAFEKAGLRLVEEKPKPARTSTKQ